MYLELGVRAAEGLDDGNSGLVLLGLELELLLEVSDVVERRFELHGVLSLELVLRRNERFDQQAFPGKEQVRRTLMSDRKSVV